MKRYLPVLLFLSAASGHAATLFMGTYHDSVIVFDEAQGKIVDTIPLTTGLPNSLRLSEDKKTLYVTTGDHSGIEVIDIATRKITNHFELNTPTKRIRFAAGGVPDPQGKLIYTVSKEMDKLADHYEISKPKYTVIDLATQKIVKTVDIAKEDDAAIGAGRGRAGLEISPDGKYLYHFGQKVLVLSTSDFKVVDRLDLAKPDLPGMEDIGFGGQLDSIGEPGSHVSLFNSSDPIVHNRVFGIGRFDLNTRQMTFDPIGPAPAGMTGLQVTPDKSHAYTVVTNGTLGNKRCEFWQFDLQTDRITNTREFPCRSRFSFGMSGDGKQLYIYGAGFQIDAYDAATLQHERTWDLNYDTTGGGMIVVP
jgi:DNA-binding beta-propeller fold protein YncE